MEKEKPSSFIKVAKKGMPPPAPKAEPVHVPSNEDIKQMLQQMQVIHKKIDKKLNEISEIPELANEKVVDELITVRKADTIEVERMKREQDALMNKINTVLSIPLAIPEAEYAAMQKNELARLEKLKKEREELKKQFMEDLKVQKEAIVKASKVVKQEEKALHVTKTLKQKQKPEEPPEEPPPQPVEPPRPSPSPLPSPMPEGASGIRKATKGRKGKTLGSRRGWIPMK